MFLLPKEQELVKSRTIRKVSTKKDRAKHVGYTIHKTGRAW